MPPRASAVIGAMRKTSSMVPMQNWPLLKRLCVRESGPGSRGRPMVNLLPLANGEIIQTVLPLPEDEEEWKNLHVVFVTALGGVRRNSMDSFTNVPTNGKIAMRFDERSEEHTSELQSLMRTSYAVFCLKKKNQKLYSTA